LMRVITADLESIINLKQVSDQLSIIASLVLDGSSQIVWHNLSKKHGKPSALIDGVKQHPEVAIIAYGKLGGLELGYGSDLDIVFLHDSEGEQQQTDGDKCIDNSLFFARMAQRTTAFLTTFTTAGSLYEIDTRLRPNGKSGMLVSSLSAFEHYQRDNAWVWEHQALVRARVVVGSPEIREAFNVVRKKVLSQVRVQSELQKEVREMRERMYSELNKAKAGEFDAKHSRGGMVDIEFMVQYTVLAFASQQRDLLQWTDNVRLLEMMAKCSLISHNEAKQLTSIYLSLRQLTHQQALQGIKKPLPINTQWETAKVTVQSVWQRLLV